MKKYIITSANFVLLIIFITACSNDKKGSDRVEEHKKPEAALPITDKHIRVPMSGFYIIPPSGLGYVAYTTEDYLMLKSEGHSFEPFYSMTSINSAVEGDSLMAVAKAEAESKNQLDKWTEEKLTVGGHPARLYGSKVMYDGMYYNLYFTDGFGKQMLNCNYQVGNPALAELIHESFKTVLLQSTQYGEASHNQ